jgi:hypothetical protein
MKNGTRLGFENCLPNLRQEWLQRLVPAVRTMQNYQTNLKARQILLVDNVGIHGNEDIKFRFHAFEQSPVGDACPPLARNCGYHVVWKIPQESSGKTLVQNDPHAGIVSNTSRLAASNTATTCSRFTVGKSYRKRSIESPSSRQSNMFCTGTRVPAKTGVPPRISGDDVTMCDRPLMLRSVSQSTKDIKSD